MRVYIAGPIHSPVRGLTPEVLKARFGSLKEHLASVEPDWEVVNPLDVGPACEGTCEDRSGRPAGEGHAWECWMKGDLLEMLRCDAIVLLPHWPDSNGARLEASLAEELRMPIYMAHLGPLADWTVYLLPDD